MDNYHKTMAIIALMMSLRYAHWDHRMSESEVRLWAWWTRGRVSCLARFTTLLADGAGRGGAAFSLTRRATIMGRNEVNGGCSDFLEEC